MFMNIQFRLPDFGFIWQVHCALSTVNLSDSHCTVHCTCINIYYNVGFIINHPPGSKLKVIHVDTIIYQLSMQITCKICIHMQDVNSRGSTYTQLSCFYLVILNVYWHKTNLFKCITIITIPWEHWRSSTWTLVRLYLCDVIDSFALSRSSDSCSTWWQIHDKLNIPVLIFTGIQKLK